MTEQSATRDAPAVRLGARIRRARLARNLTQSEVAQKQFSVSYISAVERGQIRPSLGALEKLAERLYVPLSELLREDDSMPIPPLPSAERGESSPERAENENRLREGLILLRQQRASDAVDVLLRLRTRNLTPHEQTLLHWYLGRCYGQLGRADDARREFLEAVSLAERNGDQDQRGWLYLELGNIYSALRKHQLALEQYQVCQDAIAKGTMRDPLFQLSVLYHIGDENRHLGEYAPAMEALSQAATLAGEIVNPEQLGTTYWTLSTTYASQGDVRRARAYALRSAAAFEEAGNQQLIGQVYNRLGNVYALLSQPEDALVHLQTAYAMAERRRDPHGAAEAQRGLAIIYLQQGRTEDATRAADEAMRLAAALRDAVLEGEAHLAQAEVLNATRDYSGAERSFERAIEFLREADASQPLSEAYKRYSAYLEERGQGDRALAVLKQAWQLRERAGLSL
ncbi:MAG: tetratricopeptide repeat protein [Ktedonobacterales bacterium]|nr:tetratricopeptide repeat protein [Ktedonobacterales bacterium]